MKILVLGAGATGAYFGARLIESGSDVTFLVRPARAERLRAEGLRVVSEHGDFAAPVSTLVTIPPGASFDVVLLACKAYDLDSAIAAIAPAIGARTRVVPLLNGMRHLDALDLAFGAERVWGGLCHIPVTLQDDGVVRHLGKVHRLTFGARREDPRTAEIAPALLAMPVSVTHSERIVAAMWEKWAFLSTLAAMTCVMRGSIGQIVATPDGTALMRRCYAEARGVAQACGHPVGDASAADSDTSLTAANSPLTASMLRDLERGARTECEHILGDLVARGARAGLDLPLLATACAHLRVYEGARTL